MKYGLKEVADVTFLDVVTNEVAMEFSTLKVSSIENEAESATANGGKGGGNLVEWDYNRSASLSISDALLSDESLALLAGTKVKKEDVFAFNREIVTVSGATDKTATLKEAPVADSIQVYKYSNGIMTTKIASVTVEDKTLKFTTGVTANEQVIVFYDFKSTAPDVAEITFSANKFPGIYRVIGDTVVRGEDGIDRRFQFQIPKAKVQTAFPLTMDVENVSTLDFTLNVLVDNRTQDLYKLIRM